MFCISIVLLIFARFMESEVELNEAIQEMHVVATVPHLYHIMVDLNAVQSLLQLLTHDNTGKSMYWCLCYFTVFRYNTPMP